MKKSKSVFALSVAGVTLASAIASALPAGAFNFTYNNATYDVNTYTGSFNDLQSTLTSSNNALWGNDNLAVGLAEVVKGDLGYPNSFGIGASYLAFGPNFAYRESSSLGILGAIFCNNCSGGAGAFTQGVTRDLTQTYATATAVPWELSGSSTIIGTAIGIGLGMGLKRLKGKIGKKEE